MAASGGVRVVRCLALTALLCALLAPLPGGSAVLAATRQVAQGGANSGDCTASPCATIGYAIQQAGAGDSISVGSGRFTESFTVDRSVTINGAGESATFIDGGQAAQIMVVNGGVTATVSNVTIAHGVAPYTGGGGVANAGTLTLDHVSVTDNTAKVLVNVASNCNLDSPYGGFGAGIMNSGTLALTAASVTFNSVSASDPDQCNSVFQGNGAGIYNTGALTVTGSDISNNSLQPGSRGFASGAGILTTGYSATVAITNSTLTHNDASYEGAGGAIGTPDKGTGPQGAGAITIDHTTISDNSALDQAIHVDAPLTITNSTFTHNTEAPPDPYGIVGGGGAIYDDGCPCIVRDTTFTNHTVANYGGVVYLGQRDSSVEFTRDSLSGNTVNGQAALVLSGTTVTMTDTTVSNNSVDGGSALRVAVAGTGTITNDTISNNTMTNANENGATVIGGGDLTITNSTFSNNSVTGTQVGNALGGGLRLIPGYTASITGSTFSGNSVPAGYGGGLYIDPCNGCSALNITNSTFSGNTGGGIVIPDPAGDYSAPAPVTFTNITVANNDTGITSQMGNTANVYTLRSSILKNTGANCTGFVRSGGYNVSSDGTCGISVSTDLTNTDPKLAPLANNGGATQTMALAPGSPAIDRIPATGGCNGAGIATDQRGVARPQGPRCDAGAYEFYVNPAPQPQPPGPVLGGPPPVTLPAARPSGPTSGVAPNPLPPGRP